MNGFGRSGWSNPLRRLREMERQMNRLFGSYPESVGTAFPPVNVRTDADGATVTAELPGVEPNELDISVRDRTLSLSGERKAPEADENDRWLRRERVFGSFTRTLDLPFAPDPDTVEAGYRDGVLHIRLDRSEADKPRKITVKS